MPCAVVCCGVLVWPWCLVRVYLVRVHESRVRFFSSFLLVRSCATVLGCVGRVGRG